MEKKSFGTYHVAKICNVTPPTVGRWIDDGLLPSFSTGGGHRRVLQNDLVNFLKQHNIPVPAEVQEIENKNILIVDDEAPVRELLKRMLTKRYQGLGLYDAVDGFEAGQKVVHLQPALVILDIYLPGVDGISICRRIRGDASLKHSKILAISGQSAPEIAQDVKRAGGDDFLAKPFAPEKLYETLEKIWPDLKKQIIPQANG